MVKTLYSILHRSLDLTLSGKTLRERAEAMASIAHPDFREELMKYAQENFK